MTGKSVLDGMARREHDKENLGYAHEQRSSSVVRASIHMNGAASAGVGHMRSVASNMAPT